MMPLVSIITAVKNEEKYIERCINSVLAQSYQHIEHILILGESEDNTEQIIVKNKNKKIKTFKEIKPGIYSALNLGIEKSAGDFLLILGADDHLTPNAIEMLINALQKNESDFAVGYASVCNRENNAVINKFQVSYDSRMLVNGLTPFCHQAMLASRKCYDTCGMYDEKLSVSSDYKWIRNLFIKKMKIAIVDSVVVYFADGGFSKSHQNIGLSENKLIVQQSYNIDAKLISDFIEYLHRIDKLRMEGIVNLITQCDDIDFLKSVALNLIHNLIKLENNTKQLHELPRITKN